MNKRFAIVLLGLIFTNQIYSQLIKIEDPIKYLPAELISAKIGMPYTDFLQNRDTLTLSKESTVDFIRITDNLNKGNIKTVVYKFDMPEGNKNKEMPLYEITITFSDSSAADKFLNERFTSFARATEIAEKEWFLPTSKEYRLLVRKQGMKIMIAANMSGTEWGYD